jgi:hypothetical protein
MDHINKFAIKFLPLVKEIPEIQKVSKNTGSIQHVPSIDLTGKIDFNPVSVYINPDNSIAEIYKTVDKRRYGFEKDIYPKFIKLTNYISSLSEFIDKASPSFILEVSFVWIVDSFLAQRVEYELLTHLQMNIDKATITRTYHFPVLNLHIEEAFEIGNAKFQFFTKEFFEMKFDQIKNPKSSTREEFEKHYKNFYGKVVISCKAKAEPKKCEELAFKEASLAMDVFRLFTPAIFIPSKVFKVDLEKRINLNYSTTYFSESEEEESKILLHFDANNDPHIHKKEFHDLIYHNGLDLFSNFIKRPQANDLYKLIIQSISFYSFALSIIDLHLRISQLFMIIEGLLLEDGFVRDLEKKSKRRFCGILFSRKTAEASKVNSTLTNLYQIRHQFTHKGNRIVISQVGLMEIQVYLVEFLKKLITLNQNIKTKNELINFADKNNLNQEN